MRKLRLLAVFVALVSLAGCASLLKLLQGGLKTPAATFQHADLQNASLQDVTVAATFRLDNPNPIGLALAGVGYGFSLDGHELFEGQLANGLNLPPGGSASLVVPVRVPYSAVPELATTLATKTEAPYAVDASATVHTLIGDLTIPLHWTGTLPIPKLPQVKVSSVRVRGLSFSGAQLVVALAVENPNGFALPLTALDGQLLVSGQAVASLGLTAGRPLAAKQTTAIELPIDVSFASAGLAVSRALTHAGAPVRLRGHATIAGRAIPLDLTTAIR